MKFKKMFLDSLYPRCCPVCHKIVAGKNKIICDPCLEKLKPISQPRCFQCGKSMRNQEQEYCGDCIQSHHVYDQGIGIYVYDDIMRRSIENFKFHGRREYGDFYIRAMAEYARPYMARWRPQGIVPIPMTARKQKLRGFNQSEYLAEGIGTIYGIPVFGNVVVRTEEGKAQKELNAKERRRNLKRAFRMGETFNPYKTLLLVDDVYTTGSTIDAVAEILRENGAERIYFLTLCQGKGF